MEDYGGGGSSSGSAHEDHFYLIYDSSFAAIATEYKNAYYKLGVSTGNEWVFSVVDDATDDRLRDDLTKSSEGSGLYERIRRSLPCFVFSSGHLKTMSGMKSATVHKIHDFDKDIGRIYKRMNIREPNEISDFVSYLRGLNEVLELKPNLIGLGVNLNKLIEKFIDKIDPDKRFQTPDHRP